MGVISGFSFEDYKQEKETQAEVQETVATETTEDNKEDK